MFLLVLCAAIVSLSQIIIPPEKSTTTDQDKTIIFDPTQDRTQIKEAPLPVYLAVLSAFIMPTVCTVYAMIMRYVEKHLKLDPTDFATSYWGFMSLIF